MAFYILCFVKRSVQSLALMLCGWYGKQRLAFWTCNIKDHGDAHDHCM